MHARTGTGPDLGGTFPQPYPPAVVRAGTSTSSTIASSHPLERDRPPTKLGRRSSIRVQLRLGDRVIGGLGFMSFEHGDLHDCGRGDRAPAGRLRRGGAVAPAAGRAGAGTTRSCARAPPTSSCSTTCWRRSIDTGRSARGLRTHLRDRAEGAAARRGMRCRSFCPTAGTPGSMRASVSTGRCRTSSTCPSDLIRNPDWEHEIVDDLATRTEPHHVRIGGAGLSIAAARAGQARGPVRRRARVRVADALGVHAARHPGRRAASPTGWRCSSRAIAKSRRRRRADEASARAAKLEARVRLLTEELDARTGYRRVVGDSPEWRAVLDAGDAGGADRDDRAAARRIGHRQGSRRALRAPRVAARTAVRSSR